MEKSFGEFLRQQRLNMGLTQKELSKMLYVSESTISKWEKDVSHPDISLLPELAEIFGCTEHELITASIDKQSRQEKVQAKRWRNLSFFWDLFFYIAYGLALLPCFICNLAIDKTLSWFWIVLSALILSFTFTNLPSLIKKHKLIFVPLSSYCALCLLLGTCCIYTSGSWFFVATLSVLLGLVMIFVPIYIAKYQVFSKFKKYNDFLSVAIDFILLNILLIVINLYTLANSGWWYLQIALPIVVGAYAFLNLLLSVRFLKLNKFLKTSIILFLINLLYLIPPLLTVKNSAIHQEINDVNIFKANLSCWKVNGCIENNVHLIIALTLLALTILFFIVGLTIHLRRNSNNT